MKKISIIILSSLVVVSCHVKDKIMPDVINKSYWISDGLNFNVDSNSKNETYYITYCNKKHGPLFAFDSVGRILRKEIYFSGDLLQEKEYYWNKEQLDSVRYSIYDYTTSPIRKLIYLSYPKADPIFFVMKFKPLYFKRSSFRLELIGKGGIAALPNNDRILKSEELNSKWDDMVKTKRFIDFFQNPPTDESAYFSQAALLLKETDDGYLEHYAQIILHHVPLFVRDSTLVAKADSLEIVW